MKRYLLVTISMFAACSITFAQDKGQMTFKNDFRDATGGLGNLTSMFMDDGSWKDANGEDAAIIRIKITNMSLSDMKKLDIKGSPNLGIGKKVFFDKEQQWLIAVSAGSNMFLEMVHNNYGISSRLNISQQLKPKTIYDVTLVNARTTSIHVSSIPEGADVYIDDDKKGKTPCDIPGQTYSLILPYNYHTFRVSYGGKTKEKRIKVNKPEMNHVFKLSAKNDIVWPWQREYEQKPFGFSMGYVSKQIVAKNGSNRYKFDPAYFRENKSLSGIQVGIHFQPTFSWGGGFYTGLLYELYMASCDDYGDDLKNFTEHSLTMYANTKMSDDVKEQIYPSLKKAINGCNQLISVNKLLNYVQTGFEYEYDDKVWGHDRAFFAEESLYYPYCDCEDRSILFTRLVRDLIGLDCILVYYPRHLAAAVAFTEDIKGDYIKLDNRKYIICDPTYIGAGVGITMPNMNNSEAKVILLNI